MEAASPNEHAVEKADEGIESTLESAPLGLAQVLEQEFTHLGGTLSSNYISKRDQYVSNRIAAWRAAIVADREQAKSLKRDDPPTEDENAWPELAKTEFVQRELHSLAPDRTALCLSGGGIRSATFNLGILQALAGADYLEKFHYLSTVSGGGYIGSWLSTWIYQKDRTIVFDALKRSTTESPLDPAFAPIAHLREFSNYLSRRLGLFSADTWTLFATYVRNLLLNWLVILPVLALLLVVPRLAIWGIVWLRTLPQDCSKFSADIMLMFAAVFQGWAVAHMDSARILVNKARDTQSAFLWWCWAPLLTASAFITVAWVRIAESWQERPLWLLAVFIAFQIAVALGGWVGACVILGLQSGTIKTEFKPLLRELWPIIAAAAFAGWLTWLFATASFMNPAKNDPRAYVLLAVPLYLLAFLLAGVVLHGMLSLFMPDEDREWTARAGAWLLIASFAWLVLVSIVLYGPTYFLIGMGGLGRAIFSSGGTAAGLLTALLARNPKTPATKDEANKLAGFIPLQWLLGVAALLFILSLLTLLSLATDWLVIHFGTPLDPGKDWHLSVLLQATFWQLFWWIVGFLIVATIFSVFVNVNKFSLHATYRNRLIRAYLAASRWRRPDASPFTGFAAEDNLPLHKLANQNQRPFQVINIALNLVAGNNLAWQQRKAESFTATPLHCGSTGLGYRPSELYGGGFWGAIKPRKMPEGAITLGTAMTISGAAANPNMGYHSSPLIAFLMTLFNVRLGAWLGNPGVGCQRRTAWQWPPSWGRPGPGFAVRSLCEEALGLTDDRSRYVNLSDGGHFENLGIYEMVRRRCNCIVVSDAGEDPSCSFEDLGNAIRKIYIDMGIEIHFEGEIPIYPREPKRKPMSSYCAIATIGYKAIDDPDGNDSNVGDGHLIYIKPAFYGDEPADIYNYAQGSSTFPHESTANQFFTESQFESYRKLGHFIGQQVFPVPSRNRA